MSLADLHRGFRDRHQRRRAGDVVADRLADDRAQEECRVLMRFWWQLHLAPPQLDEADLARAVGPAKRAAVQALIDAIRDSPDAVDAWIEATSRAFPVVHDRGWAREREAPSPTIELRDDRNLRRPPRPTLPRPPSDPCPGDDLLAIAEARCEAGADGSALALGRVLELRGDLPRAEAAYRLAGETGDANAFYALGRVLHALGEPDYRVTAACQSAADAGHADAMYALATLEGCSTGRAGRYLSQAAALGHPPARYALGYVAFLHGDVDEAIGWWTDAAAAGFRTAADALAALREDLREDAGPGA